LTLNRRPRPCQGQLQQVHGELGEAILQAATRRSSWPRWPTWASATSAGPSPTTATS